MADTLLCIDSSTGAGSVCLRHDGALRWRDIAPGNQAAELLPAIESLLAEFAIGYGDLTGLAATIGPGSFTGLRIGLAVARTIAFLHPPLAVYPVSTLECLAAGYEGDAASLLVTLKAGKGEMYSQYFSSRNAKADLQRYASGTIELALPAAWTPAPETPIIGNTADLTGWSGYAEPALPHARYLPDAVARIAIPPDRTLKPLYIRPPDAKLPVG